MVGLHNQSTVRCFVVIFLIVWFVTPATAQPPQEPIGLYVIDLQGSFVPFSRNVELAENRGLNGQTHPVPEPAIRLVLTSTHFAGKSLLLESAPVFIPLWLTKDLVNGHQIQMALL